ncbi:MAG: hypothetical protein AB7H90_21985 [Alphaproteobacteria bacterium]
MATEIDFPIVVLASGEKFEARRVKLYEADKVQEIASLKATAAKQLAGISTGISFWGDPAWALGGATVLGIIEGLLSAATRKQGIELLNEVQFKFQQMTEGAIFFDAVVIKNFHAPHPQAWFASKIGLRYLDVSQVPQRPLQNLLRQYNKLKLT